MPPEPGWVHRAQITILEAAEVLLDWLWFAIASSSASFATVNPLLLQQNTGAPARAPRAVVLCCVVLCCVCVVRCCAALSASPVLASHQCRARAHTGHTLYRADELMSAVGQNVIPPQPQPAPPRAGPAQDTEAVGEHAA